MTVEPRKPQKLTGHYLGAIYGPPGCGKTTLAAGGPNPVHVDTGNESLVLAYTKGLEEVTVYPVESHQQIMEIVMDVRIGKIKCKTLVIDNVTDQQRLQLSHSAEKLKTGRMFADVIIPIQQDYNIGTVAIGNMLDEMKKDSFPADVLLIMHAYNVTDKAGNFVITRHAVTPALATRVAGAVDFLLYMKKEINMMRKETTRTLYANATNMFEAKNRIALPNEFPAEDLWSVIESRREK